MDLSVAPHHDWRVGEPSVTLRKRGLMRSIAFGVRHIEEIVNANLPLPVINQVCLYLVHSADTDGVFAKLTCTRSWFRKDVLDYSKAHGIALEVSEGDSLYLRQHFKHPHVLSPTGILVTVLEAALQTSYAPEASSNSQASVAVRSDYFRIAL